MDEIQPERVQYLNARPERPGAFVLYWMQQSQRAEMNHALEHAAQQANRLKLPLLVGFGLTDGYPEANLRHYRFLLEGLQETAAAVEERGSRLILRRGAPDQVALDLAQNAALVVCDRGYTRHQKQWRQVVAAHADCPIVQVETDVIVPVDTVMDRPAYSARSFGSRLQPHLPRFLAPLRPIPLKRDAQHLIAAGEELRDLDRLLSRLQIDRSVPPVTHLFHGGTSEARARLRETMRELTGYERDRSRPETGHVSHLSPYLHFGQISPVFVALEAQQARQAAEEDRASFLDELTVRRELAQNWVHLTEEYDQFSSLPDWARETLATHASDRREHCYTLEALERAETHDPYWNAAMREMRYTGFMHNLMRMYWGKKLLEWSPSPEEGFARTLWLNNRYFLDGRDPSSFANVAWIYGLHDRPWPERPVYGIVRSMAASGLERKCDIRAYVARVDRLVEEAKAAGVRFAGDG